MIGGSTRRLVATLLLVGSVAVLVVVGLSKVDVRTDLDSFLPQQDPVAERYARLTESFGADPVVVMLQARSGGSLLGEKSLQSVVRLEGQLSGLGHVSGVYGPGTLLNQIAGRAQDLLSELLGRRDAIVAQAKAEAKKAGTSQAAAGTKARAAFDDRYGPLLVSGLPSGLPTLGNQKFVNRVVFDDEGHPRGQWKLVVPAKDTLAILVRPDAGLDADQTSRLIEQVRTSVRAADLTVDGKPVDAKVAGASVIVAALSDRAVRDVPVLGALAVVAIGLCFMAATWIRRDRRLLPMATTMAAILVTVATLGWLDRPLTVAVIAFLSVLLGIGSYYPTYLAMRATTRTFVTVVTASACSLGTLAFSPLPLVRDVGLVLALGVALAGIAAWLARPWLLASLEEAAPVEAPRPSGSRRTRLVAVPVLGLLAVGATIGWIDLAKVPLSTDVDDFAAGLSQLDEAREVETVLGSSGEVSVVLGSTDVLRPEQLAWMRSALATIVEDHGDQVRPIVSMPALTSFLGDKPTADQIDAAYRLLPLYMTSSVVSPDRSVGVMTFGVSIDDLSDLRRVLDSVRDGLPPAAAGDETQISGLPTVLLRAETLVSDDRYRANVLGIAAAGLVLLIGLRRRLDAVRGIVAATLATGTGFLLVSLSGGGLNPITGALGALTAAVGCEFTVMLAESARGGPLLRRAVLLVAATSALGYLVLLASGLEAVRSFGLFLAGGVALALLCSWVVVAATVRQPAADADDTGSETTHDGPRLVLV